MAEKAPDYTVTSNPYALIHCGPIGSDADGDDGRDLTIATSVNCQTTYYKSGNKMDHIQGYSGEVCGYALDSTQEGTVAKAIIAENGDIVLDAEGGNIRLQAKNVYIETSGEQGQGNFMVSANGLVALATGHEFRASAGRMCLISEGNINFSGNVKVAGKIACSEALNTASFVTSLLAGNWASVITSITQTCK